MPPQNAPSVVVATVGGAVLEEPNEPVRDADLGRHVRGDAQREQRERDERQAGRGGARQTAGHALRPGGREMTGEEEQCEDGAGKRGPEHDRLPRHAVGRERADGDRADRRPDGEEHVKPVEGVAAAVGEEHEDDAIHPAVDDAPAEADREGREQEKRPVRGERESRQTETEDRGPRGQGRSRSESLRNETSAERPDDVRQGRQEEEGAQPGIVLSECALHGHDEGRNQDGRPADQEEAGVGDEGGPPPRPCASAGVIDGAGPTRMGSPAERTVSRLSMSRWARQG